MNRNKFLGDLRAKGHTLQTLSKALKVKGINVTPASISRKLNGHYEFRLSEIKGIAEVLDYKSEDIQIVFFEDCVS